MYALPAVLRQDVVRDHFLLNVERAAWHISSVLPVGQVEQYRSGTAQLTPRQEPSNCTQAERSELLKALES